MKKKLLVTAAMAALAVAGCGGDDVAERIIESQEGVGNVEIDESDGSVEMEIEDEEGNVTGVIGGGEVPDDFPMPIPAGADVQSVFQQGDDATLQLLVEGASFDSVAGFYQDWVDGSGLEEINKVEFSNPQSVGWTLQVGDGAYTISVAENADDVLVTLFVAGG